MTDPIPTAEQVTARIEKWLACEFQNLPVYGGRPTRLATDADSLYADVIAPLLERLAAAELQRDRYLEGAEYERVRASEEAKATDQARGLARSFAAERDMARWLHAEAVWQRDSERASRQDWAVEADRLEHELEQARAALAEIGYDPAVHAWAPDSRVVMESMLSEYSEMLRGMARRASELRRALDDTVVAFGVATAIGKRTRRRTTGLRAEVESLRAQLARAVVLPEAALDEITNSIANAVGADCSTYPGARRVAEGVMRRLESWRVSPDTPLAGAENLTGLRKVPSHGDAIGSHHAMVMLVGDAPGVAHTGIWQPQCSCGWTGEQTRYPTLASLHARDHESGAHAEQPGDDGRRPCGCIGDRYCGQCIDTDPEYQAHRNHNGTQSGCGYCLPYEEWRSFHRDATGVDPGPEPDELQANSKLDQDLEQPELAGEARAGVDFQGPYCANPDCPCQRPGRPCNEWQGVQGMEWCPRCGWHRRHHPETTEVPQVHGTATPKREPRVWKTGDPGPNEVNLHLRDKDSFTWTCCLAAYGNDPGCWRCVDDVAQPSHRTWPKLLATCGPLTEVVPDGGEQ